MTKSMLVWALVFAPCRLLAGTILSAGSIYMLMNAPGAGDTQVFVPARYAFGSAPWFIGLIAGIVLVLWALSRGRSARTKRQRV